MGFDFIVIAPLLPSHCGFSFVFGCGVSFGEFQCLPVDDCSAVSCDFGALARGSEHTSFYSTILIQSQKSLYILLKLNCYQLRTGYYKMFCVSPMVTTHTKPTYGRYTKENEKGIKECQCKKSTTHKKGRKRVKEDKIVTRQAENNEQNGNSKSFPFSNYFKCKWRDFSGCAVVKNPPASAGDTGSIPGLGRSHMLWSN